MDLELSSLGHTWILDLDGTLLKHNGYKIDGIDTILPGAKEFLDQIPDSDLIIIVTSRKREYEIETVSFLKENNIRYNYIIWEAPYGERIIINDNKPSGLVMSKAIEMQRDKKINLKVRINNEV